MNTKVDNTIWLPHIFAEIILCVSSEDAGFADLGRPDNQDLEHHWVCLVILFLLHFHNYIWNFIILKNFTFVKFLELPIIYNFLISPKLKYFFII